MNSEIELLKLARERFQNLSPTEEKLFRAVAKGEQADFCAASKEGNDPNHADKWPAERTLKADRIAWLCTDPSASRLVTHHGIAVAGARVDGMLNLEWANIAFPLVMQHCAFSEDIILVQAHINGLALVRTHIKSLIADAMENRGFLYLRSGFKASGEVRLLDTTIRGCFDCQGGLFINAKSTAINASRAKINGAIYLSNGFKAKGEVHLSSATIGGSIECSGGQFINVSAVALNANGTKIGGSLNLNDGFRSEGEVCLLDATMGRSFNCSGGRFINANAISINANRAKIAGDVFLRNNFKSEGEVLLLGASIGGSLECQGGQFLNKSAIALTADGVKIERCIFFANGFKADGEVRLLSASIGMNLACDGGQFFNANAVALNADGVKIGGYFSLRNGFKAEGAVRLLDATIGRSVDCSGGQFLNSNAIALNVDGVKVGGSLYLRNGFKAEGEVRIFGATIGRNLECSGGQFINNNATAITADGVNVGNGIFFIKSFKADGAVRLLGASIGGNLECDSGQFINTSAKTDSFALQADGIKIDGCVFLRIGFEANGKVSFTSAQVAQHFQWHSVKSPEKVVLDLRSAKVGTFCDEEKSWPNPGNLFLDGFVYDEIYHFSPTDAKTRVKWIKRQPPAQFLPQPYEQLAGLLRKMGHEDEADKVMIEKNDDIARRIAFFHPRRWLQFFFKLFVGYGYRPRRAFAWSLLIILIGTLLFSSGDRAGIMTPTKESAYVLSDGGTQRLSENYPKFNSFIYSLEMFTPLLKLEMGDYWQPNANRGERFQARGISLPATGSLLRDYLWFHIILGWVLTTLWVGGLTGLVKK